MPKINSCVTVFLCEVKAGKTGRLKSLHVFVTEKKIEKAIRFNADIPLVTDIKSKIKIGTEIKNVNYQLISLPLYLVSESHRFL